MRPYAAWVLGITEISKAQLVPRPHVSGEEEGG